MQICSFPSPCIVSVAWGLRASHPPKHIVNTLGQGGLQEKLQIGMLFIKPVFVLKHGLLNVTQSEHVRMTRELLDFGATTHFLLLL